MNNNISGMDGFQEALHTCVLDESRLSMGRVRIPKQYCQIEGCTLYHTTVFYLGPMSVVNFLNLNKIMVKCIILYKYQLVLKCTVKPQKYDHLGTRARAFTLGGVHILSFFS